MKHPYSWRLGLLLATVLAGCSHPALREAETLSQHQQLPQAHAVLAQALREAPQDTQLRMAKLRVSEQLKQQLITQIEAALRSAQWAPAQTLIDELRALEPQHPRLATLTQALARAQRHQTQLAEAQDALRAGKLGTAEALARTVLAEAPQHSGARSLLQQLQQARPLEHAGAAEMGAAFQKIISLEFREAPLRQVFEVLARSSQVDFVFDKDVRADARVTLYLRGVTLDEALRIILNTQQLDRKLLNEQSVLIFPATQAKQREHQELMTRTFYLTNAEVKQVQALVRTMAKVRDIHIDERLNLLVVRDTPEVLRLVERLVASVDMPEPEVMLEVEVLELASDSINTLGLQWPESVSLGLPGGSDAIVLDSRGHITGDLRATIANPLAVAKLKGSSGNAQLLANPKIRVKNHDKARVVIGQKVPVFTTTTNFTGQTSVAASVSYLDVGLKLEVEPTIQLDNDVSIKVNLEVSNIVRQVTGPGGTTGYEIGTRQTTTSLRLADGETQVLAGLISDEDRHNAAGLPGLSGLPLLGRLFGVQGDTRSKNEVVLLITPRVLRNLSLPDAGSTQLPAGTDASPGAFSSRLRAQSRAGGGLGTAPAAAPASPASSADAAAPAPSVTPAPSNTEAVLRMDVTPQVDAGGTVAVSLRQDSGFMLRGQLEYDATRLESLQTVSGAAPGRIPFELPPRGERVLHFRALPAAAGQSQQLRATGLAASGLNGERPPVRQEGAGLVAVGAGS
ncbi:secretin N-terminal domain-containing protein [Roseateles sp. BYS180W]|uniref:Secretin N-terminal domain-containing protein n=1 Tax=Roseateles rivi TaxID=3299028 RepID=A0ABW7FX44_9BURK